MTEDRVEEKMQSLTKNIDEKIATLLETLIRVETAIGKVLETKILETSNNSMNARPSKREISKNEKPSPGNFLDSLVPLNNNVAK